MIRLRKLPKSLKGSTQGEITLSQYLISHHPMKMCEEMQLQSHAFLTTGTAGNDWKTSCSSAYHPKRIVSIEQLP
jgi:hypothetical protein